MDFSRLTKPITGLYRARGYFLIGLLVLVVQTVYRPPFESIPMAQRGWYHDLIDKGIGSLDKAAILIFLAGLSYAVFSDVLEYMWTVKFQDDLREGFKGVGDAIATGVSGMTHESIISWVQRQEIEAEGTKIIGLSALTRFYGDHSIVADSYLKYVVSNILDRSSSQSAITRKNLSDNIVLRKISSSSLLKWEDDRRYTLICPNEKGEHPLTSVMSCRADADTVEEVVKHINLVISVDNQEIFSFEKWLSEQNSASLREKKAIITDDVKLSFDGKWIEFRFNKRIPITKYETSTRILETSLIPATERCFYLVMDQPTFNLQFTMRLEGLDSWHLKRPTVGATWYHSQAAQFATIDQNNASWVSATVPKWVLPGVALVVEWAEG